MPLDLAVAFSADERTLQILEQPKAPVNRHPASGAPTFFSSLHSQSAYLQRRRAGGGAAAGGEEQGGLRQTALCRQPPADGRWADLYE